MNRADSIRSSSVSTPPSPLSTPTSQSVPVTMPTSISVELATPTTKRVMPLPNPVSRPSTFANFAPASFSYPQSPKKRSYQEEDRDAKRAACVPTADIEASRVLVEDIIDEHQMERCARSDS